MYTYSCVFHVYVYMKYISFYPFTCKKLHSTPEYFLNFVYGLMCGGKCVAYYNHNRALYLSVLVSLHGGPNNQSNADTFNQYKPNKSMKSGRRLLMIFQDRKCNVIIPIGKL